MKHATYLSFGAGRQSTALLIMSALGLRGVPKADFAVFADTQAEPTWVYEQLAVMTKWAAAHGIPILTATAGDLGQAQIDGAVGGVGRFASVPFWTLGDDGRPAPGRRQCTREHKIDVVIRTVREFLGLAKGERSKHTADALIGISWDERQRVSESRVKWITNRYPLVDLGISVAGCESVIRLSDLPVPRKSACRFCPYHDDDYWADLRDNHPEEWRKACEFDAAIRDQQASGKRQASYLHRTLTPLPMARLQPGTDPLGHRNPRVGLFDDFALECEGMCGL